MRGKKPYNYVPRDQYRMSARERRRLSSRGKPKPTKYDIALQEVSEKIISAWEENRTVDELQEVVCVRGTASLKTFLADHLDEPILHCKYVFVGYAESTESWETWGSSEILIEHNKRIYSFPKSYFTPATPSRETIIHYQIKKEIGL